MMAVVNEEKVESKALWFGWLMLRPRWLQWLNTPKWFLLFVCMYFFTQSIVINGVYSVSITTIEKRYGYSSSKTGVLTSCYDMAALLITPFVSYLGARSKKPKWCGIGLLVMGTGFFIFTLPHLFGGKYMAGNPSSEKSTLCSTNRAVNGTSVPCDLSADSHWGYYLLFIVGMFLAGAGSTPMWNLGAAFLDENVHAKSAPMYIGIFSCAGVIGAGAGFVLGGFFLSLYVDLGVQTSLTPRSEEWVGAWWLGFIVCTGLSVLWSGWLMGFPKEFSTTQELRKQNLIGNAHNPSVRDVGYTKIQDLPKASKNLFVNISYVAVTLGVCIEGFIVSAFTAFMPKVIEQQFRFSPSRVSILMGLVVIPSALLGTFIGAYICKRLCLDLRGAAKMCFVVSGLSLLASCLLFIRCDSIPVAGVNTAYTNGSSLHLSSTCNAGCACSTVDFKPVCSDGVTFYSPCHAGCVTDSNNGSYSNCSCSTSVMTTSGLCSTDCGSKPLVYLVIYFFVVFLTFFSAIPATVVTLRAVSNDQRAYALGVQSTLARILGTIPGPIVVGTMIDRTCSLWNKGCTGTANCLQYDNRSLSMVVLVTGIIAKVVVTICYLIARFFGPKDSVLQENDSFKKRKEIFLNCENGGKSIDREAPEPNGVYCFKGLEQLNSRETKL